MLRKTHPGDALFGPGNKPVSTIFGKDVQSGIDRSDVISSLSIGKRKDSFAKDPANVKESFDQLEKALVAKLEDIVKLMVEQGKNTPDPEGLKTIIASAAREAMQSEFQ